MLHVQEIKDRFFSVKHSMVVRGTRYIPAVCYKLTSDLQRTVEGLVKEGLAAVYPQEVRFVSGVPYPVKRPEAAKGAAQWSSSVPVPQSKPIVPAPASASGKSGVKRLAKGAYARKMP
jgi:hypothetical protein